MDDNAKTKTGYGFVATRPKDVTTVFMMVVVTMYNFCMETKSTYENVCQTCDKLLVTGGRDVINLWLYCYATVHQRCRSQWPRDLRRGSAAARLLRLWVRIPPGVWMFVCCECCVLAGRGLCDELITRPEESYRLWYVVVCDLEPS